jgi:hypothetical protein
MPEAFRDRLLAAEEALRGRVKVKLALAKKSHTNGFDRAPASPCLWPLW